MYTKSVASNEPTTGKEENAERRILNTIEISTQMVCEIHVYSDDLE